MRAADVIGAVLSTSIFVAVLSLGMGFARSDLREMLQWSARLVRSLLVMNVLSPIVTIVVCKMFDLHPAVIVALVTLSIAPVGALFPQGMTALVGRERGGYANAVFFVSTLLSVAVTPLAVEALNLYSGGDVHVDPLAVAGVAVGSLLLPLGLGLAIGKWWPAAKSWISTMQRVSGNAVLLCIAAFVLIGWSRIVELVSAREGTIPALALITLIGLTIGHALGGPNADDRTVLAFASVSRHPGVAIVVASLTDQTSAPVAVLLAVAITEVAVVPYKVWRTRTRQAGPPAAAPPPSGAH